MHEAHCQPGSICWRAAAAGASAVTAVDASGHALEQLRHNAELNGVAETLFGITMETKGISKVVSVNLERERDAA